MEIYRRYAPALLRKCERLLRNPDDAEDVVHGLFVHLLEIGRTDVDLPYLYRAATNRCLNLLASRDTRRRLLEREDATLRGPIRVRCDDVVIGLELLARLSERLDRKGREILVYRFVDDLTQDEIATLMATSRRTVGTRLARIRDLVQTLTAGPTGGQP